MAFSREKIEKVPLRHEGDEFAAGGKVREIRERHIVIADLAAQHAQLLMRPLEEIVEHAKLVHDLERRGMDGVAAEIAEEIGVLLQHDDIDAGAGKKKSKHHARPVRRRRCNSALVRRSVIHAAPSRVGDDGRDRGKRGSLPLSGLSGSQA